jgi:hypothetical protein
MDHSDGFIVPNDADEEEFRSKIIKCISRVSIVAMSNCKVRAGGL